MATSSGAPNHMSYGDKLLCLGNSGLLEPHFSAAKALSGWKEYFTQLNEKQCKEESVDIEEGLEQEEDAMETWRRTGKLPKLQVSAEEYEAWCRPFMNSLIVKLLGKSLNVGFMRWRMERMWASKGPIRVTPLNNGYFLVPFSSTDDRDYALQEGPWMIADHYLLVQRWRPNFNPWKADNQKRVAVWVRIPDLPHELYNVESIRRIGNMIGKTLKIDWTTAFSEKGGFARMCVEIDLQKPLLPGFIHFGEERRFVFEGLHLVCFTCGRYGHRMDQCEGSSPPQKADDNHAATPPGSTVVPEELKKGDAGPSDSVGVQNLVNYGPQMLVQRDFGKKINKDGFQQVKKESAMKMADMGQGEINGAQSPQDPGIKGKESVKKGNGDPGIKGKESVQKGNGNPGIMGKESVKKGNGKEDETRSLGEAINNNGGNQEWILVGSKRKAGAKARPRGKENRMDNNSQPHGKGKGVKVEAMSVKHMEVGVVCERPSVKQSKPGPTSKEQSGLVANGVNLVCKEGSELKCIPTGMEAAASGTAHMNIIPCVDDNMGSSGTMVDAQMVAEDGHGDSLPTHNEGHK
ncbi:hypothetical protein QN277_016369 [Acacia crassicarpa]|uniref:CCHC-type domain-containing protein n=1 Tax=Acacia crassicarpa TaxID=499986 RepID=A0AAE1MWH6_9FABA|nr:hypothetical protein QN277_016369 [Acacia crassicarpa]